MLSFEWDSESEQLQIHTDKAGLDQLLNFLTKLSACDKENHIHLMTENWGGEELSGGERQNESATLINHVKVFKW